ncbi:MAG: 2-oxoacid:acceptor oxidoreductase family protein [Anaerolineae bacterium]|nr:2-oxoacid:acceptor oxidoreductase family protein [Anaerolineae bacterium]
MFEDVVVSGSGGQGVMFAGQLLAYAAMDEGLEVTWIPSYGPEMRGGTAHCYVVISDHPIGSPLVQNPKLALVFNEPSFAKYEPLVAPGGVLVINQSIIAHASQRHDIAVLPVPASEIAGGCGSLRVINMVLLGAALAVRPILPFGAVRRALEQHLPEKHRNLLALNLEALERGADCTRGSAGRMADGRQPRIEPSGIV